MPTLESPKLSSGIEAKKQRLTSVYEKDSAGTASEVQHLRNSYNQEYANASEATKAELNEAKIDPKMILETALRPFYLEVGTQGARDNERMVEAQTAGKARNFWQKAGSWFEETAIRRGQDTYAGIAQTAETLITQVNKLGSKIGLDEESAMFASGKDNLKALTNLTEDIFADRVKYPDANSITEALRARIIERMVKPSVGGFLAGEGALIAYAISKYFNNSTSNALHEFKNNPNGTKVDYVLKNLTSKLVEARSTQAVLEGEKQGVEANLLRKTVLIQDKLKGSALGVTEGFDVIATLSSFGIGTVSSILTSVVKRAMGNNLTEAGRMQKIEAEVAQSDEFKAIYAKINSSKEAGKITEDEAKLVTQEALSKLSYNTYLEVINTEVEVNEAAAQRKQPKNWFRGNLAKFVDVAFAKNEKTSAQGKGYSESELRGIIANQEAKAQSFSAEEKSEAALELLKMINSDKTIIATAKTEDFVTNLRKEMSSTDRNGWQVAGLTVAYIAEAMVQSAVSGVYMSPLMIAGGVATSQITGGQFSFSGMKGASFGDAGLFERRMGVVFNVSGDLNAAENAQNVVISSAMRANAVGNIMSTVEMGANIGKMGAGWVDNNMLGGNVSKGLTTADNLTGNIVSKTATGISETSRFVNENIVGAAHRVTDFAARVAGTLWTPIDRFITPAAESKTPVNTLPQPAKAPKFDVLAQVAGNVVKGGTDNFKSGDTVKLQVGGSALDGKVLGRVGGDDNVKGAAVIRPNLEGVTVKETIDAGNVIPKLYDANGNEIKTTFRTAYLMKEDGSGNVATDAKGNKVVVFVTDGEIKGATQLSENTISSSPTVRADNNTAVNPAVKPEVITQNTAKPDVKNNVVPSNLSGNFRLTGGGENGLANRLMQAGLAEEKNGGVFIKQPTSININGRNIVIPVGQYSALTIANAARISDTSIQGLNNNPVAVSFGSASPDLTTQPKPVEVKSQTTVTSPNNLPNSLDALKQRTGLPVPVETAPSTNAKASEGKDTTASIQQSGKLNLDVSGVRNFVGGLGLQNNNMALAAELNSGIQGFGGQSLADIDKVVRELDSKSNTVLQRIAANFVANPNYKVDPETANLVLPGGLKVSEFAEIVSKNPAKALEYANRTTANTIGTLRADANFTGSFMVLPAGFTVTASGESKETSNVVGTAKSTISSGTLQGGISLPNSGLEGNAKPSLNIDKNGNVKLELPVFSNSQSNISEVSVTLPGNKVVSITNPEIINSLNSGKTVSYDTLLSAIYTTNPELGKSAGLISVDSAKPGALDIKSSDGKTSNYWKNVDILSPYAPQINKAIGDRLVYNPNVGDRVASTGSFAIVLSDLDNPKISNEAKAQILKDVQAFANNPDRLDPKKILNFSPEERAKYSAMLLIKERNPEILTKAVITPQDIAKLASGLNVNSVDSVIRANARRITGEDNRGLLQTDTPSQEKLNQILDEQAAAKRRANFGRRGAAWLDDKRPEYGVKQDVSDALKAMNAFSGNNDDFKSSYSYNGTISAKGFGVEEKASLSYENNGAVSRSISEALIDINRKNPQYESISSSAATFLGPLQLGNFYTDPTLNKLAIGLITAVAKPPLIGIFSIREQEEMKSSNFDAAALPTLSNSEIQNKAAILAFVNVMASDKDFEKRYIIGIGSDRLTPDEALFRAAGGVVSTEGKTSILLPNGERKEFANRAEAIKMLNEARSVYITVQGIRAENASISPNNIVIKDGLTVSTSDVTKGGSTFDKAQVPEIARIVQSEAKEVEDALKATNARLQELKADKNTSARLSTNSTPAGLAKLFPGMQVAFIGTGEYRNGDANVIKRADDNVTPIAYDAVQVAKAAEEFKRTGNPVILDIIDKLCDNKNPLTIRKGIPLGIETSGKLESKGGTNYSVAELNRIKEQNFAGSASVEPLKPPTKNEPKKEEPTPDQKELQPKENTVQNSNPTAQPGGVKPGPQQTGTGVEVKAPTPSATPGANNLPVQQATNPQNIAAPTPAVQPGANVNVQPLPQVAPQPVAPIPSNIAPATPSIPQVTPITPNVPVVPAPAVLPQPPVDVVPVVVAPPSVPFELAPSAPTVVAPVVNAPLP